MQQQSSQSGNTALHAISMHHGTSVELIKLLILHNNNENQLSNIKNKKNELPLHSSMNSKHNAL